MVEEGGIAMPGQARNYKYLLLAVATVLLTLLMSIAAKQGGKIDPAEGLLRDLLAPLQKAVLALTYKVNASIRYVAEIRRLGEENAYLNAEITRLKARESVAVKSGMKMFVCANCWICHQQCRNSNCWLPG